MRNLLLMKLWWSSAPCPVASCRHTLLYISCISLPTSVCRKNFSTIHLNFRSTNKILAVAPTLPLPPLTGHHITHIRRFLPQITIFTALIYGPFNNNNNITNNNRKAKKKKNNRGNNEIPNQFILWLLVNLFRRDFTHTAFHCYHFHCYNYYYCCFIVINIITLELLTI